MFAAQLLFYPYLAKLVMPRISMRAGKYAQCSVIRAHRLQKENEPYAGLVAVDRVGVPLGPGVDESCATRRPGGEDLIVIHLLRYINEAGILRQRYKERTVLSVEVDTLSLGPIKRNKLRGSFRRAIKLSLKCLYFLRREQVAQNDETEGLIVI